MDIQEQRPGPKEHAGNTYMIGPQNTKDEHIAAFLKNKQYAKILGKTSYPNIEEMRVYLSDLVPKYQEHNLLYM
jgi:hypothetical protein